MKKLILLLLVTPAFASLHYVGKTLEPTGKVALYGVKAATYPVRHPVKTSKGTAKAVKAVVVTVF
jgi:hypothetical protein